jgi:hypothetical protein
MNVCIQEVLTLNLFSPY